MHELKNVYLELVAGGLYPEVVEGPVDGAGGLRPHPTHQGHVPTFLNLKENGTKYVRT